MADDFLIESARRQYADLQAQEAQEVANLRAAQAQSDHASAEQAIQTLADLRASQRNLAALTAEYQASQQPQQAPPVSREQRAARQFHEMDAQDLLELARTSKYGKNLTWDDPHMQAGYAEAVRRRQRGGE